MVEAAQKPQARAQQFLESGCADRGARFPGWVGRPRCFRLDSPEH